MKSLRLAAWKLLHRHPGAFLKDNHGRVLVCTNCGGTFRLLD